MSLPGATIDCPSTIITFPCIYYYFRPLPAPEVVEKSSSCLSDGEARDAYIDHKYPTIKVQQECIPVVCVLPTSVAISPAHIPPTTHAPLPCTPPAMHIPCHTYPHPCHACPLSHMPHCHACPLTHAPTPCHACPLPCTPPAMHALLPCMSPATHVPTAMHIPP